MKDLHFPKQANPYHRRELCQEKRKRSRNQLNLTQPLQVFESKFQMLEIKLIFWDKNEVTSLTPISFGNSQTNY